jgi:hypothetical protein
MAELDLTDRRILNALQGSLELTERWRPRADRSLALRRPQRRPAYWRGS